MENEILNLIEEEIRRRVQLQITTILEVVSRLYEIPLERLVKDTSGIECKFCKGILRSKKRCLKEPRENGYCGFHQKQAPGFKPETERPPDIEKAPWEA
jgi:Family of unknown function (DUF5763)